MVGGHPVCLPVGVLLLRLPGLLGSPAPAASVQPCWPELFQTASHHCTVTASAVAAAVGAAAEQVARLFGQHRPPLVVVKEMLLYCLWVLQAQTMLAAPPEGQLCMPPPQHHTVT